jgi:hypothetical protein
MAHKKCGPGQVVHRPGAAGAVVGELNEPHLPLERDEYHSAGLEIKPLGVIDQ